MKDTCVFYRDFRNAARNFSADKRAAFYEMVFDYAMDGIEPPPDSEFIAHFELIRSRLDTDIAKYRTKSENGKKGGAPKGNQNAKKQANSTQNKLKQANSSETSHNVNVNVNEYDNVTTGVVNARESFCETYGIVADAEPPPDMDFEKLAIAFSKSPDFLQRQDKPQLRRMSWIIKNYDRLLAGDFDYHPKRGSNSAIAPQGITHSRYTEEEINSLFTQITEDD